MSGWQTRRLGDILRLNYGKSLPVKNRIEGPIPVYGSNGIVGSHSEAIVAVPGLIVGRKGSAGEVHRSLGPFCPIDTTFYVTEADAPDVALEFLFYLLRHLDLTRITGDVGVPGLNREMAYMEPVQLPTAIPEQKKIAHVLSTVQQAIEAQERIIRTTSELKKALMHKLFTEGLSKEPQKQTEIGPVPESWEVCKVGDVAKIQSGGTPTREIAENWSDGTIPWVKTGEINYCVIHDTEEKITSTGLSNSAARLFPKGTLLMAMYGQGITRGRVGLLGIEAATNQACASITPAVENRLSSIFLYYFFEYHYEDLRKLGHGANQRNMNAALIRSFPLAFPEPDEQAAIVTAFESLDQKRALHERKKTQLQDLFRTLLHELMTAKTRVHEMEFPQEVTPDD